MNATAGSAYVAHVGENGTITLSPINIPVPPRLEKSTDMHAIYVSPSLMKSEPPTITIFSVLCGSADQDIAWLHNLSVDLKVPLVIRSTGIGAAYIDKLVALGAEVYEAFPGLKQPIRVAPTAEKV